MKTNKHRQQGMSQAELEQRIEDYFDCTLTEGQERELRLALATTDFESDAIAEAKAVMGIFAVERNIQRRRGNGERNGRAGRGLRRSFIGYAAAACLVLALGISVVLHENASSNVCVMYADGEVIRDTEAVLAQMNCELDAVRAMDEHIDQTITSELQGMAEAMAEIGE